MQHILHTVIVTKVLNSKTERSESFTTEYFQEICSLSNNAVDLDDTISSNPTVPLPVTFGDLQNHFNYFKPVNGQNLEICHNMSPTELFSKRSDGLSCLVFYYIRNSSRSFKVT